MSAYSKSIMIMATIPLKILPGVPLINPQIININPGKLANAMHIILKM